MFYELIRSEPPSCTLLRLHFHQWGGEVLTHRRAGVMWPPGKTLPISLLSPKQMVFVCLLSFALLRSLPEPERTVSFDAVVLQVLLWGIGSLYSPILTPWAVLFLSIPGTHGYCVCPWLRLSSALHRIDNPFGSLYCLGPDYMFSESCLLTLSGLIY